MSGLWLDPTADLGVVGVTSSWQGSSYGSLEVLHLAGAWRTGRIRWSAAYGLIEIRDLFDSAFASDPSLASLRARSTQVGLDAAGSIGRVSLAVGLSVSGDDNFGDYRSTASTRIHARLPISALLQVGAQASRTTGGSIQSGPGRVGLDVAYRRTGRFVNIEGAIGAQWGRLWKLAEVDGCGAARAGASIGNTLLLEFGGGRCATTFGARRYEWERSVAAVLTLGAWELGIRYAATRLGAGSGAAVSLTYEAGKP